MSVSVLPPPAKLLADPNARRARLAQVHAPHVAPLNAIVEQWRARTGLTNEIPYFDPCDGGVDADTLFLMEAPGPKAVASGFVSRDNPDETAKNLLELSCAAGIDRKRTVLWNVVPWYIGNAGRIRAANARDLAEGRDPLSELLGALPNLRVAILFGRKAQKAARAMDALRSRCELVECPHPSPMFVNRQPGNRGVILDALRAGCLPA